jgi:hypothetical protein
MTKTLIERLFPRQMNRLEREAAYLNESVSLYDLECRQRDISRGKFAGF